MDAFSKNLFPFRRAEGTQHQKTQGPGNCLSSGFVACLCGIFFALVLVTAGPLQAAGVSDNGSAKISDSRLLPWVGSWRLVSNTVNRKSEDLNGNYLLKIDPTAGGKSLAMKVFQDKKVLFEDTIIPDGVRQPLKDKNCSGWYSYSWSDTGKRLLFESESACPDSPRQKMSGISLINEKQEWLDIQLLQSNDERIITIRRYSPLISAQGVAGYSSADIRKARYVAASNFSINEIIELNDKVASEVLEASLLELRKPFTINSKTLVRLADSNVPDSVIDLMVAISFPDKFYIERDTVPTIARAEPSRSEPARGYTAAPYAPYSYYSFYDPYFPWRWTPYTYSLYWDSGWGIWPAYLYYPASGGGSSGWDERDGGRLVAGRGYTSVHARDGGTARPRGSGDRSTTSYRSSGQATYSGGSSAAPSSGSSSGSYSSGGSSSGSASSGGSSSGGSYSSGSSSGSSGGGSPSASPGGYSSGGSGSGGHAQGR
jgi:hypothetical protein